MLILPLVWLQGLAGVNLPLEKRVWISIVPAMVAAIVVAWPFARLLRIPPMFVFSGPCPACKRRPAGWWKHGTDAGEWQLACGECGERVTLWVAPPRRADAISKDVPTYVLKWPRFLGVWRRIDSGAAAHTQT
jgi:hypothetical protein